MSRRWTVDRASIRVVAPILATFFCRKGGNRRPHPRFTLAVDSRTISSASTLILISDASPDINLNRLSIAICPMRRMGWRTVVSGG